MKLRRRDPNQLLLGEAYNSLRRDADGTELKRFRTLASNNDADYEEVFRR